MRSVLSCSHFLSRGIQCWTIPFGITLDDGDHSMKVGRDGVEIGLVGQIGDGKEWHLETRHDGAQLQILLNILDLLETDRSFVDILT